MDVRDWLVWITGKAKYLGQIDQVLRYNPSLREATRKVIADYRSASPAQRQAITDRLAGAIIERARKSRYGRTFGADIGTWPVLSKDQVRDHPYDFLAPGLVRIPAATGGTTGVPLRLCRSLRCIAAEQVFLDDLLAPHGLTWDKARVAVLRGDAIKRQDDHAPPFGKQTHGGRRLVLSTPHLTAASLDWYLGQFAAFKPDLLFSAPTNIANLVMLLERAGRDLRIPLIVLSSERLDAGLRGVLERELGATVIEYYGMAERAAFAVCNGQGQWFFEPTYGKVELIPSAADELINGYRHVPIIATGYWNSAQPLIRYNTGDRVLVPATSGSMELAAIARGERPFLRIAGRENEFVLAPDGRRLFGLNVFPREVRNVLQIQVVQDGLDHITIRVLAAPGFGRADRNQLIANAKAEMPSVIAIDVEVVERLEITTQGKAPFVIRRVTGSP